MLLTSRFREEKPVRRTKLRPSRRSLDGELVAKPGSRRRAGVAAEEEGEKPKQVEQKGDH
jgi:hypothetical protein